VEALPTFQVAYGLQIEVEVPIPGLLSQPQQCKADVRIRLNGDPEFLSTLFGSSGAFLRSGSNFGERGDPALRVGRLCGGRYYGFLYADGVRFAVERSGREIWGDWPHDYALEDACTYLVGPIIAFALRLQEVTCLHASAIAVEDHAVVLIGAPGSGKSTTAAAFAKLGFPVLVDDVVALRQQGDVLFVQPGYPRLNLWPDSVRELFGSEEALPRITPTWGKRFLALDGKDFRFQSSPLPLGAIYFLGAREANLPGPVIEPIIGNESVIKLVSNVYGIYLLDRSMQRCDLNALGRVAGQTPVRRVRPPADPAQVYALCRVIATDVKDAIQANYAAP
jgi:hypothetical protein